MGLFTDNVVSAAHSFIPRQSGAQEQGGVISGDNPVAWSAKNPLRLWVIQVVIIITVTQLLAIPLKRIRQPRVIAEVIGGIILGPTVMGNIPKFHDNIFPPAGMPGLALTSTIGLVLFMFLVGLEIDTRVLKRNALAAGAVSAAGLIIPLGLGAALGVGVYRRFIDPSVNEGYFVLFTAVAIGITAFPVLCRILSETKLLDDVVGVVTLSAGIGNDVIGWVLLALVVTLVNASSGLTAVWILLATVGFCLFLFFPVKWAYVWLARRTGSLDKGTPTSLTMTITVLLVLACAFFTDIIGVHAIFGGFLVGLIIPHDNGFAISLTEKLEDLVSILFLPIYFTLSGLRTDMKSLDTGVAWGYTVLICLVAFTSKFVACGAAAYLTGFKWRAAGAIGALMSCKGLVELIVLNIGRDANILDTRTFSMFVLHAVVLTVVTTPLTLAFYPPKHRLGSGHSDSTSKGSEEDVEEKRASIDKHSPKERFSVILERIEQLPAAMTISQLLQSSRPASYSSEGSSNTEKAREPTTTSVDVLRLIELTNRTSAVMKSTEADSLILTDPLLSVYRTFGQLNQLPVSPSVSVLDQDEFADAVANHAVKSGSQMILLPWSTGGVSETPSNDAAQTSGPLDGLFPRTHSKDTAAPPLIYSEFIRNVFLHAPVDVGVYIDRSPVAMTSGLHLVVPFIGGPDDRLALSLIVELCGRKSGISATFVRIQKTDGHDLSPVSTHEQKAHYTVAAPDTVYGNHDTATRLASDTADNVLWDQYDGQTSSSPRSVKFTTVQSPRPLQVIQEMLREESQGKHVIAVVGRSRRLAVESHAAELSRMVNESGQLLGSSVSKTLGDVGASILVGGQASLLVVQTSV
ncbi:potassium:hydrogen antiporter [Pterulicium gracile]|uniref:Potassium:hydrogen antiporter n=1 Tax=Pterulicium gracile TaxID=1884261 RepID=A0A5C3QZT3_9AGAR|nr:potassium:hydrogen antiporter [Pterula gracilis]